MAVHGITAALWKNTIILSGYESPCLYSYDGTSFLSEIDLPASIHKIVFDGWVLTPTTLFKAGENNTSKWTGININQNRHLLICGRTLCAGKANSFTLLKVQIV